MTDLAAVVVHAAATGLEQLGREAAEEEVEIQRAGQWRV